MDVRIDDNSGFCFGVVRAIGEAEAALQRTGDVSSLGDRLTSFITSYVLSRKTLL